MNRRQLLTRVLTLWAVAFGAILAAFLALPARGEADLGGGVPLPAALVDATQRRGPRRHRADLSQLARRRAVGRGLFRGHRRGLLLPPSRVGWPGTSPRSGEVHRRAWPSPPRSSLLGHAIDQPFVVALPEEFFFRGWMQTRLKRVFPRQSRSSGVTVGPALLLTAALFALVHLTIFQRLPAGGVLPRPPLRLAAGADRDGVG